jgi:hypothetical protein
MFRGIQKMTNYDDLRNTLFMTEDELLTMEIFGSNEKFMDKVKDVGTWIYEQIKRILLWINKKISALLNISGKQKEIKITLEPIHPKTGEPMTESEKNDNLLEVSFKILDNVKSSSDISKTLDSVLKYIEKDATSIEDGFKECVENIATFSKRSSEMLKVKNDDYGVTISNIAKDGFDKHDLLGKVVKKVNKINGFQLRVVTKDVAGVAIPNLENLRTMSTSEMSEKTFRFSYNELSKAIDVAGDITTTRDNLLKVMKSVKKTKDKYIEDALETIKGHETTITSIIEKDGFSSDKSNYKSIITTLKNSIMLSCKISAEIVNFVYDDNIMINGITSNLEKTNRDLAKSKKTEVVDSKENEKYEDLKRSLFSSDVITFDQLVAANEGIISDIAGSIGGIARKIYDFIINILTWVGKKIKSILGSEETKPIELPDNLVNPTTGKELTNSEKKGKAFYPIVVPIPKSKASRFFVQRWDLNSIVRHYHSAVTKDILPGIDLILSIEKDIDAYGKSLCDLLRPGTQGDFLNYARYIKTSTQLPLIRIVKNKDIDEKGALSKMKTSVNKHHYVRSLKGGSSLTVELYRTELSSISIPRLQVKAGHQDSLTEYKQFVVSYNDLKSIITMTNTLGDVKSKAYNKVKHLSETRTGENAKYMGELLKFHTETTKRIETAKQEDEPNKRVISALESYLSLITKSQHSLSSAYSVLQNMTMLVMSDFGFVTAIYDSISKSANKLANMKTTVLKELEAEANERLKEIQSANANYMNR